VEGNSVAKIGNFRVWHITSFRCFATIRLLSRHSGLWQAVRPADLRVHGLERRGLHFLHRPHSLTASFFGRDLALDAKGKGVRFGIFAVPGLDRHGSVQGRLVFLDRNLLDMVEQELPPGRKVIALAALLEA